MPRLYVASSFLKEIINKSSLIDYLMMLKWSLDLSQPTHWDFSQLPTATWHSSQFSDSVFQISHSKILFAVSKSPDLFNPSPKYVLKFSQSNPYSSRRQLLCSDWVTLRRCQVCTEAPWLRWWPGKARPTLCKIAVASSSQQFINRCV